MKIIGDPKVAHDVFNDKNPHGALRVAIATPCGMGGAYQAGILHALEDRGITNAHLDVGVGLSAGSWNMTAFAAGQAHMLCDVYVHLTETLPWNALKGDFLGLHYLKHYLRGRLDEGRVRTAKNPVHIGVSDLCGVLSLPDVRHSEDIHDLCHASSSIPVLGGVQSVNGMWMVDPACADPCPLGRVLKNLLRGKQPVDVLVLAGRPEPEKYRALEQWFGNTMTLALMWGAWYSWPIISSALEIDRKMAKAFAMCAKKRLSSSVRLCALVPEEGEALPFTFDVSPSRVQRAGRNGYEAAHRFADGSI